MLWLGEHRRNPISHSAESDPSETILQFPLSSPRPACPEAAAAVDLVHEAAEMIRGIQERAAAQESGARRVVEDALDRLRLAGNRIYLLEAERLATEERIDRKSTRL